MLTTAAIELRVQARLKKKSRTPPISIFNMSKEAPSKGLKSRSRMSERWGSG